jgi:hypothetical protein
MIDIATDCEGTNQDMEQRCPASEGVYFRFNVDQGMQKIKLGEWELLPEIKGHTKQYMKYQHVQQKLGQAVEVLRQRVGVVSTTALVTHKMEDFC